MAESSIQSAQSQRKYSKSLVDDNNDLDQATSGHLRNDDDEAIDLGSLSKRQGQEGSSGSDSSQNTQDSNNDDSNDLRSTQPDSAQTPRTSQSQPSSDTESDYTSNLVSRTRSVTSQSSPRDDPSEDTLPFSRPSSSPSTRTSSNTSGDDSYSTPTSAGQASLSATDNETSTSTTQREQESQKRPSTTVQTYSPTSTKVGEESSASSRTSTETSDPTSVTGTAPLTGSRSSEDGPTQTSNNNTSTASPKYSPTSSAASDRASVTSGEPSPTSAPSTRDSSIASMEASGGYTAASQPQETDNGSDQNASSQQPTQTRGEEGGNDNGDGGNTSQPTQSNTQGGNNNGNDGDQPSSRTQDQPTTEDQPQSTSTATPDDTTTSSDDSSTTTTSRLTQTRTQPDPDTSTTTQETTSRTSQTDSDTSTTSTSTSVNTGTQTQSDSSTSLSTGTNTNADTSAEPTTGTSRGTFFGSNTATGSDSSATGSDVSTAPSTSGTGLTGTGSSSYVAQSPSSAAASAVGGNAATSAPASAAISAGNTAAVQTASADAASSVSIGQQVLPTSAETELSRLSDIFQPTPTSLSPGESVYFSTGTDANGVPTTLTTTTRGRNPFLNGNTDGGLSTSGKIVAGTVTGIVAGVIIIAAVVWLLGKRRRSKFVRPIVERLHTTGSAYSLPGLVASGGAAGGAAAHRRRSRAFSIESADSYAPISFENGGDLSSPERWSPASRPHHHRQMSSGPDMSQIYRDDPSDNGYFLPAGAAPYSARSHGTYPSSGSALTPSSSEQYLSDVARSQHRLSGSTSTHATTVLDYANASDGSRNSPTGNSRKPQLAIHLAPSQQELLYPSSSPSADDRAMTESPLYSDNPPLPKSPTLQPTLLQRRTTDPFGVKHSLRVINPDVRNSGQSTASIVSPTSISRASTPSVMTTDNEFYYDEPMSSSRGQTFKPMHLDLAKPTRPESAMSNGSVYTPNQVDQVGFFRGD